MPRSDAEVRAFVDQAPIYRPPDRADTTDDAPLPLLRFAEWQGRPIPAREWIVPDWMPSGQVTALYGDGGTGKSLLAQQLMTACAIGGAWVGLGIEACRSVGLFCEDDDYELLRRQDAINASCGVQMRDLGDMVTIARRVGEDNALMTFDRDGRGTLTPLWHRFRQTALDFGARLAVIDTAADTFGGNEVVRSEVRQFVSRCLGALARDIGGAVLLCAHPSVRGIADGTGASGSTAWNNTVRSRLYLTRPAAEDGGAPEPNARVLSRVKSNYAAIGDEVRLRWDRGVLRPELSAGSLGFVAALDAVNKERAAEEAFLACLRDVQARGQHASDTTASRDRFAPKLFRTLAAGRDWSRRDLEAAMHRLLDQGRIRVASVRNGNGNYVSRIVEVASS